MAKAKKVGELALLFKGVMAQDQQAKGCGICKEINIRLRNAPLNIFELYPTGENLR